MFSAHSDPTKIPFADADFVPLEEREKLKKLHKIVEARAHDLKRLRDSLRGLQNPGRANKKSALRQIIKPKVLEMKVARFEYQQQLLKIEDRNRAPLPVI